MDELIGVVLLVAMLVVSVLGFISIAVDAGHQTNVQKIECMKANQFRPAAEVLNLCGKVS